MSNMLSIVIVTCNRQDVITKCLESCLNHTIRNVEFVIVDNNSTDNTEETIKEFLSSRHGATLNYIKLDKNTGVSYARNVGYRKAHGDILFFIDDDAEVISDGMSLDAVYDYMKENGDVAACTGKSLDYRYGGDICFLRDKTDSRTDYYAIRGYVGFNHFIRKGFSNVDYIYPDNLFYGSEELYCGLMATALGKKVINISSHVVEHHPNPSMRLNRKEGLKNGHINTYVIKRYFCPFVFQPLSFILFFMRICRFSKFNIKEIVDCLSKSHARYNKKYCCRMSIGVSINSMKKFGVINVL